MPAAVATFRPPIRRLGGQLLAGAVAGGAVAVIATIARFELPFAVGALLGALAAGIAAAASHARGPRLVADARGVRLLGPGSGLEARWEDLRLAFGLSPRDGDGLVQRYAILADPAGRSFAFADFAGAGPCQPVRGADGRPVPVVDLREAAHLLALVVQRTPAWFALPESLWPAPATPSTPGPTPTPTASATASATARTMTRSHVGILALVGKLGAKLAGAISKLAAGALKALKTANVGWAAASAATYGLLFSWKFAVAIMVQLFVHEYGHVHAMRRTGMKVRGMYFIPFLGAMAVTDDSFSSRRQQAYVALAGPLWGSALAVVPVALWLRTGDPVWAGIAAWWALINLFNLLPIAPLDGGRVLHAFAASYSSSLGVALAIAGLAAAVLLGLSLGFSLLWLVAAIGAMELATESQARAGAHALRLLPEPARFVAPHWLSLRAAAGPPAGSPTQEAFLASLARQSRAARAEPMTRGEMVRWGLAYLALAGALVGLVWLLRAVPGAEAAAGLLR